MGAPHVGHFRLCQPLWTETGHRARDPDTSLVRFFGTDPDLHEFGFGDLQLRAEAELLARYVQDRWFAEVLHGKFAGTPGGE